jgi:hypothetical protein
MPLGIRSVDDEARVGVRAFKWCADGLCRLIGLRAAAQDQDDPSKRRERRSPADQTARSPSDRNVCGSFGWPSCSPYLDRLIEWNTRSPRASRIETASCHPADDREAGHASRLGSLRVLNALRADLAPAAGDVVPWRPVGIAVCQACTTVFAPPRRSTAEHCDLCNKTPAVPLVLGQSPLRPERERRVRTPLLLGHVIRGWRTATVGSCPDCSEPFVAGVMRSLAPRGPNRARQRRHRERRSHSSLDPKRSPSCACDPQPGTYLRSLGHVGHERARWRMDTQSGGRPEDKTPSCGAFVRWGDPDSNRGHHVFRQAPSAVEPPGLGPPKSQTRSRWSRDVRGLRRIG